MSQMLGQIGHHEAHESIKAQRDAGRDGMCGFSLSAMYRSAGSPVGRSPIHWAAGPASALIAGMTTHHRNLDALRTGRFGPIDRPIWTATAEDAEEGDVLTQIEPNDLMTHLHLATIYASFLDGLANQDTGLI